MIHAIKGQKGWGRPYILWFGACGPTNILVYANGLEAALEDAAQEIHDRGWLGHFNEPDYKEAFEDLQRDGKIPKGLIFEEDASNENGQYQELIREEAETDLTYTESGYIADWEWGIVTGSGPDGSCTVEEIRQVGHSRCCIKGREYPLHDPHGTPYPYATCHEHGESPKKFAIRIQEERLLAIENAAKDAASVL